MADFDADGTPDTATAERLQTHGGGRYLLNIQLSSGPAQAVTFVSGRGDVDVTAIDVDNDRDLDLVVRPILSNEVVGVWLNDGAGRFTRGTADVPVPVRAMRQAAVLTSAMPLLVVGTLQRDRISGPPSRAPALITADSARLVPFESGARPTSPCSCAGPPRAPPAFLLSRI